MQNTEGKVIVSAVVSPETRDALRKAAYQQDTTVSAVVREMVERALGVQRKEQGHETVGR